MKLLMIAMFLVPGLALADGKTMPNGQKCADGWLCVPPGKPKIHKKMAQKPKPKPAPTVCPKLVVVETKEVVKEVQTVQNNHLRLLGGVGPTGLGASGVNPVVFTTNRMAVFGLGYGRNVSGRWSLEGEAETNGKVMVGVGYQW